MRARHMLHERVAQVAPDVSPRLLDYSPELHDTVFAVFAEGQRSERERFCGLATCSEIARFPSRVFGDLVARQAVEPLDPDDDAATILRRLDLSQRSALPVFEHTGSFLGVVRREAALEWCVREKQVGVTGQPPSAAPGGAGYDSRAAIELLELFAQAPGAHSFWEQAVAAACRILRCRYGAIGILDDGRLSEFVTSGVSPDEARAIGDPPQGRGLLGVVIATGEALRLEDMQADPRSVGFPGQHPVMKSLLAVPIGHGTNVPGRMYLCDRLDGQPFDAEDETLAKGLAEVLFHFVSHLRAGRAQRVLERRMRELERAGAVELLAAEIAHDLGNVMTAIQGYAELAQPSVHGQSKVEPWIDGILHACGRASELVARLVAVGRDRSGEPTLIDLNAQLRALLPTLAPLFAPRIELCAQIESTPQPVWVNQADIEMLVLNLAFNARKAMPSGGRLVVSTSIETRAGSDESFAVIEVADTGRGMSAETLRRAFEPGLTTGGGSGLGLASVQRLVRAAGGQIAVDSTPGAGTQVRILLPLAPPAIGERNDESADAPAPAAVAALQPLRILVVDDDRLVRDALTASLTARGHQVEGAADGRAALRLLASRSADVVLTDIVMPDIEGLELCRRIARDHPRVAVVTMSGAQIGVQHLALSRKFGARASLVKPIRWHELCSALAAVAGRTDPVAR